MSARNLRSEIHYASRGSEDSLDYLRGLPPETWAGTILLEHIDHFALEPQLKGFCKVLVLAGEDGARALRQALASRSLSCQIAAVKAFEEIGAELMPWAIPLLEATAADTTAVLRVRNAAARAAAVLANRPMPEAIRSEPLPTTTQALRAGLEQVFVSEDHSAAVRECANRLGAEADAVCAEFFERWLREGVADFQLVAAVRGCAALERAAIAKLEAPDEDFAVVIRASSLFFANQSERIPLFEALLATASDEQLPAVARALAAATDELCVADLRHKNEVVSARAMERLAMLDAKYVGRQALSLVDTMVIYEGIYSWGDRIYAVAEALDRVDGIADVLLSAFRSPPDDRYWRQEEFNETVHLINLLTELDRLASDFPWAGQVALEMNQGCS